MKDLTEKQEFVLQYISDTVREKGFPPTIREIGDQFGITAKGAYDHLKAIEKKVIFVLLKTKAVPLNY